MKGFGLAKVKHEGEIADPDDFDWEHDPLNGTCKQCSDRYSAWLTVYVDQELQKAQKEKSNG